MNKSSRSFTIQMAARLRISWTNCSAAPSTDSAGDDTGWMWRDTRTQKVRLMVVNAGTSMPTPIATTSFVRLNDDLPFDQFIIEQLAADKLESSGDNRMLAALGFLTVGNRRYERIHEVIDERIDVISRGLLGLTVGCARCHDHKFDAIPNEGLLFVVRSAAQHNRALSVRFALA